MLIPMLFSPALATADEYRSLTSTIRSKAQDAQGFFGGAGRKEGDMPYLSLHVQLRGLFVELYIELRPRNTSLRIAGFRNIFENGQAPPEAYLRHVRDSAAPRACAERRHCRSVAAAPNWRRPPPSGVRESCSGAGL